MEKFLLTIEFDALNNIGYFEFNELILKAKEELLIK